MARLSLVLLIPGILLASMFLAGLARSVSPSRSVVIAPLLFVLLLVVSGRFSPLTEAGKENKEHVGQRAFLLIDALRSVDFQADTKLYSTPNTHLILTFYTGLPFQSIAAVRKTFLDTYAGDVVFIELIHSSIQEADPLSWQRLQTAGFQSGQTLSELEARNWENTLSRRLVREDLRAHVAEVYPPLEPLPAFIESALLQQRQLISVRRDWIAQEHARIPIFRGHEVRTWADWWQVFFYRFVDPESRRGPSLNYTDRLRNTRAIIIPETKWVLYSSSPTRADKHPVTPSSAG